MATSAKAENRGFCPSFLPKFPLFSRTPSDALPGSVLGGLEQTRTLTVPRGVFAAIQGTLCLLKACVAEIPRAALQKPPRNPGGGQEPIQHIFRKTKVPLPGGVQAAPPDCA